MFIFSQEDNNSQNSDESNVEINNEETRESSSENQNSDAFKSQNDSTDNEQGQPRGQTISSSRTKSPDQKRREQMMAELERLRREMTMTASTISRPRT